MIKFLTWIGVFLFSAGLGGYALLGAHMRFSGDDYCYAGVLHLQGFWKALVSSYLQAGPYHGNRFALTFSANLATGLGPLAAAFLPAFMILLWVASLAWLFRSLAKHASLSLFRLEALLLSEVIVFLTISQSPDIRQSVFWLSGVLPYAWSLVLNTLLLAVIAALSQWGRVTLGGYLLVGLLALFAAGFSETASLLQLGWLALALLFLWIRGRSAAGQGSRALGLVLTAFLATAFGLFLLTVSPANAGKWGSFPPLPGLFSLIGWILHDAYIFSHATFKHLFIPNLLTVVFFFAFSFGVNRREGEPVQRSGRVYPLALLAIPLAGFALIGLCLVPSIVAYGSYPEARALICARYVFVLAAASWGWVAGRWGAQLGWGAGARSGNANFARWLVRFGWVIALLLLANFPLAGLRETASQVPEFRRWAAQWDARDQEIRRVQDQNGKGIEVIRLTTIIPGVAELSPDPDFWYNNCAEMYYGLSSLKANQPGPEE